MKIGIIGTGYVGSVTGACLAEKGNEVICIDNNPEKVALLQSGQVPIYEPGLDEIFKAEILAGRLNFSGNLEDAMNSDVLFLCLPTPQGEDDRADLSYVLGAAQEIGKRMKETSRMIIVNKSTVPVGTAHKVREVISAETKAKFAVVSNPEFLREGAAVGDFRRPDQIVIGADEEWAKDVMRELYEPFVRRNTENLSVMDTASAELVKYGINAFLATKISFANELARLARACGADYNEVRASVGADSRIGDKFLFTGPGWGGSCFPKDTRAVVKIGEQYGVELTVIKSAVEANEAQKHAMVTQVLSFFNNEIADKKIALWGLAFKKDTDDVRESPALHIADVLTANNAKVIAFDPQAIKNVQNSRSHNPNLTYAKNEYEALDGADCLIIATEWDEFSNPDLKKLKKLLARPVVFDFRNMLNPRTVHKSGFYYSSLGRADIDGRVA